MHKFAYVQLTILLYAAHMGLVFGGKRTTKAQTSLRIRADWSAHLLFTHWKVSFLNLFIFYLVSVAEETGLSLAFSEPSPPPPPPPKKKTGLLSTRPNYINEPVSIKSYNLLYARIVDSGQPAHSAVWSESLMGALCVAKASMFL